jgi:hypothetical protein
MYEESDDRAKDELKRIDHLIFVTLKYTRTVDIIRAIIAKYILTLDYSVEDYYIAKLEAGKIKSIPTVALLRIRNMEKDFPKDKEIKNMLDFYVMLKKIYNAEYRPREEYRKNVTLVTKSHEVNIPTLKEQVEHVKRFVEHIDNLE